MRLGLYRICLCAQKIMATTVRWPKKFVQHAHEQGFMPFELAVHDLFTAHRAAGCGTIHFNQSLALELNAASFSVRIHCLSGLPSSRA